MSNKMSDGDRSFLKLVERSCIKQNREEGWARVSVQLRRMVQSGIGSNPDLYDSKVEDGTLFVRLSEKGKIVAEYV